MVNIRKLFQDGKKIETPIWNGVVPYALYYNGICVWKNIDYIEPVDYPFIAKFSVEKGEFTFPKLEEISHVGIINWGDGKIENYNSSSDFTHIYSQAGIYDIKIDCDIKTVKASVFASSDNLLSFSCTTATEYGTNAFFRCPLLKNVILSDEVTSLPSSIFSETGLISFEFPQNLKTIGSYAFRFSNLTGEVIIPEGVTTIGFQTFKYCSSITKIVFPDTLESFEVEDDRSECLHYCSNLEEIVIGNNQIALTDIPDYFYRSTDEQNIKLHTVKIAEGVTKIGRRAFFIGAYGINDCNVYLPSTITQLGSWSAYGNQTGHNHTLYVHYNGTADEWTAIEKSGTIFSADFDDVFLITKDGEKHEMNFRGEIT